MDEGLGAWPADETLDAICGGTVRLVQRARGYRFNLDPILLAHFAQPELRGPTIDLGTGSGIIPLILSRKFGLTNLMGLELQPSLYALAQRNVRLNGCEAQVALALGDIRRVFESFSRGAFAHVVSNPPYRSFDAGRHNPDPEKAIARHEIRCRLSDLVAAADWLLRDRGSFFVIYPASRLAQLIEALRGHSLEPRRIRFVHTRASRAARLVLVAATKGGRHDATVVPPLVLHPDDRDGFTPEVERMLE